MDREYSRKLASTIEAISAKHDVNPNRIAAIAMQESAYRLNVESCHMIRGKMSCDYCMMQINNYTAKAFGFERERLLSDLEYCVEAGVKVLKDFKRMYGSKEDVWWTRYNTSNPEKREIYKVAVERYF